MPRGHSSPWSKTNSPAWIRRTASISSSGVACTLSAPAAPASRAWKRASGVRLRISTSALHSGATSRSSSSGFQPVEPVHSITAISGRHSPAEALHSSGVSAALRTSHPGQRLNTASSPAPSNGWSVAKSNLVISELPPSSSSSPAAMGRLVQPASISAEATREISSCSDPMVWPYPTSFS